MAIPLFYPLQVKAVHRETNHAVAIELEVPDHLQETFAFTQGQHLTIKMHINGVEVRRNYSLCSSPTEHTWIIGVKKVEGGLFSAYANETLKPGDTLEVMPPLGRFNTPLDAINRKHYLAIAAGSGITPLLSIMKTTLATEPKSRFTLVYGNQNRGSIMFKEELEALKNRYIDRFTLYHILSREKTETDLNHGRIDAEKCNLLFGRLIDLTQVDEVFLCGPQDMIFGVKDWLVAHAMDEKRIHFELFTTTGVHKSAAVTKINQGTDHAPKSRVTIKLDGRLTHFDLAYNSEPILDAGIREGLELPFACKGGMCCTCKARLLEGEVDMEVHYGLEQDEVEAGYILTCQSHPKTETVVVDYDDR